jgi:hypothetical protein
MPTATDTTFVLTSCGRFDLLAETMLTFLANNTAPIARYVIVEDSGRASVRDAIGGLGIPIDFLVNDPPVGQMASIDRAYATVDTPYISHCEDDWRFLRGGFIEDSRIVLDARPDVSAVICRRTGQVVWHDIAYQHAKPASVAGVGFRTARRGFHAQWGGYTFHPGLRRRADWARLGSFAANGHEIDASAWFKAQGMTLAYLDRPACETTGANRHVHNALTPPSRPRPRIEVTVPDAMARGYDAPD